MKILSDSHAEVTPRPCRTDRSMSFDSEISTEEFLAGDGDEVCEIFNAANLTFLSTHRAAAKHEDGNGDDDGDDDLQWANARLPLQPASRRSGYGDGKGRAKNKWGKENRARFTRNLASSSIAIVHQPYSGPILRHSGTFSGSLTPLAKKSNCCKSNRVPSIIPSDLLRRKVVGFNACEPMSPEVTCLGRIKSKELDSRCGCKLTDGDGLSVDSQKVRKSICFDTKNQLCGKRFKGRKKKEKARRRFASVDSKSISLEPTGQTRREKAATLARSLTGILEDMQRLENERAHYEPSVPPPNSLLLMRGCRIGEKDADMDSDGDDEQWIINNVNKGLRHEPIVPPPNSLLLMRGCRIRGNLSSPPDVLMGRVPLKTKHVQACTAVLGDIESDAHQVEKLKARAVRHLSLLDLIDKEETFRDEGVSTSSDALDTGSSPASEDIGMVKKPIKEKVTHSCHRKATLCQRRSFGELPLIEVKLRTRMER
ncbi:hypothetical protein GOP47_0012997 [Adiantum capillus-veneris]|uniref:Uncharacterized protein n=1 Tax=Adiantum capillus-veneris TaxID=13818 RepID=A0A9D4URX8_ADICA|nr:hypothetical protein GOP47_0012997 [Adiantum capillus-veneris]